MTAADDLSTVQALIDAHKAAMERFDSSPQELWDYPSDEAEAINDQLNETAWALCAYRPATIEGVHLKATYMMGCETFVGGKELDPDSRTRNWSAVSCRHRPRPKPDKIALPPLRLDRAGFHVAFHVAWSRRVSAAAIENKRNSVAT